jgi:hypothetical protein
MHSVFFAQLRQFWAKLVHVNFLKLNPEFNFFIGLDQTGAVLNGGLKAKPLPCAVVDARGAKPKLLAGLKLDSFSQNSIEELLRNVGLSTSAIIVRSSRTAVLADAVFGLPAHAWPAAEPGSETLRALFAKAATDTRSRKGYGLKPAATFFSEVLRDSVQASPTAGSRFKNSESLAVPYPVRDCEILAKANSVFRTHPFQKNIQCGTYRFWRDLGTYGSDWIHLRYFERAKEFRRDRPILFEAYPSLIWREALGLQTRDRTKLSSALHAFGDVDISATAVDLMVKDSDHADACILALGGYWLAKKSLLIDGCTSNDPKLAREGWIVGLKRDQAFRC